MATSSKATVGGKVRCIVSRLHGGRNIGQVRWVTPGQLAAEELKRYPRFRLPLDAGGVPEDADDFSVLRGLVDADIRDLQTRDIFYYRQLVKPDQAERLALSAWSKQHQRRESRRLLALRRFRQEVARNGFPEPEPSKVDLDQLKIDLAKWSDPEGPGDMVGEEIAAALEQVSDGDLEELRAALELAYVAIEERKPGNMGLPKQRARIIEQIRGAETPET